MIRRESTPQERRNMVYNEIAAYHPCSVGKDLSKSHREKSLEMGVKWLTYGEMLFQTMALSIESIRDRYGGLTEGGVFYDLGSGTGKGCLGAALLHPFDQVFGVEILEKLYTSSLDLVNTYNRIMPEKQVEYPGLFPKIPPIEIIHADLFSIDFYNADVLYIASTCFTEEMMETLANLPVKQGAFAITTTKNLNTDSWEILETERREMSWAPATVFISRKL